ncbi:MAG: hypothetical protein NZ937_01855 [Armatimonadetes bacterium]|nr:hypothetical protein [Armatimonadota bacterium]
MRWACGTQCFGEEFAQGTISINTFLSMVSILGFDGVEFAAEHLPSLRINYANILNQRLAEQELTLAAISCQVTVPDNLIAKVEPVMAFAKELRTKKICLLGADDWTPFANEIKYLAQFSEQISIPLGLSLPQKPRASVELCNLLDEIASPYLGVCLCIKATILPKDEFWQDLIRVVAFAFHVQLIVTDLSCSLTWLPFLELLREVEYEGFISVVHVPEPTEESLKTISTQIAFMSR